MDHGFLYSDDSIPFLKVREAKIVNRHSTRMQLCRLKFIRDDRWVPETVLILPRYPELKKDLLSGEDVTVNIVSDCAILSVEEAFERPDKILLAFGNFSTLYPKHASSLQKDFTPPPGWEEMFNPEA